VYLHISIPSSIAVVLVVIVVVNVVTVILPVVVPSPQQAYVVFIVQRFYFLRQTLDTVFMFFVPCIVILLCNVNYFVGLRYIP
jgi:hypothetical protein